MSAKRRQYTEAFKQEAVRLVTEHGYGVTEAARTLGIHVKMLGRWKRQAEPHTNGRMGGNGQMAAEHEELLRWRQENQRLRMEREIVKNPIEARCRATCEWRNSPPSGIVPRWEEWPFAYWWCVPPR